MTDDGSAHGSRERDDSQEGIARGRGDRRGGSKTDSRKHGDEGERWLL